MLVAVIIGFVVAMATPSFVNSMKGQRIRQATRTVVACGKYARTLAVARQRPMKIVLQLGGGRVAVEEGPAPKVAAAQIYTRDQVGALTNAPDAGVPSPAPLRALSRQLDGIVVARVRTGEGLGEEKAGPVELLYRPNGTCVPYEVVLKDEDGHERTIRVDFLGEAALDEP